MSLINYFELNSPHIVQELFDDEAVIIDLESGHYYSLEQSGVVVWKLLLHGLGVDVVVGQLAALYARPESELQPIIEQFVGQLEQEKLIVATTRPETPSEPVTIPKITHPFTPPILNKYSDMQDLLALDPIHDVDATGWPHPK